MFEAWPALASPHLPRPAPFCSNLTCLDQTQPLLVQDFVDRGSAGLLTQCIAPLQASGGGNAEDVTGALKKATGLSWESSTRLLVRCWCSWCSWCCAGAGVAWAVGRALGERPPPPPPSATRPSAPPGPVATKQQPADPRWRRALPRRQVPRRTPGQRARHLPRRQPRRRVARARPQPRRPGRAAAQPPGIASHRWGWSTPPVPRLAQA